MENNLNTPKLSYEKAVIEIIDLNAESNFFVASDQGSDGSTCEHTGGSTDGNDNDP